ncbi:hypothetical protein LMH87_011353 [Akanthomyces muscarius]|uniref:Uncharacterized protein n=1 Tax=Akanthomyces muscarius TaxID=2231603 RepID=A0A9W8Q9K8_AKAMU|nr:hypothetical protein LMH87_011353 [Akanthomyces muscarius]KAJ4150611.1 hypothetical protein LMH87_011353 [Akanthomyces muscarius]
MGADSLPTPPAGPLLSEESATLLRELGDYFTRTAQMWSTMTHNLLQGPHIDHISIDVNTRSNNQTGLADLMTSAVVDVELSRLRKIRDLTAKFSQDVQAVWRPDTGSLDSASPNQVARNGQVPLANILCPTPAQNAHLMGHGHPANDNLSTLAGGMTEQMDLSNEDDSESDTGDEDLFAGINMDALKQRGKGSHICPKGPRCDKGGVDKDGNVIVFDRNSSFAQHCNKHRKPWVLPDWFTGQPCMASCCTDPRLMQKPCSRRSPRGSAGHLTKQHKSV